MKTHHRIEDLEDEEDVAFQEREWRVQRYTWAGVAVLLVLALLGVFGGAGVVAVASTASDDSPAFRLEYRRFERYVSPSRLRLHLPADTGTTRAVWIDQGYLAGIRVDHISPEPDAVITEDGRVVYHFKTARPGTPVTVAFDYTTNRFGLRRGQVGLPGGPTLDFTQFIYP